MAFDAGSIVAHLDLETREYDRKLREAGRDAQRFEADRIKASQAATDAEVKQAREASQKIEVEATRAHRSMLRSLSLGMLGGRGGGGEGGQGGGGGGNMGLGTGLFRGIGPGVLGLSARSTLIAGGIGTAGALLPSLAAGGGVLGAGAIGAGVAAAGARAVIGTKQDPGQLYQPAQKAMERLKSFIKDAAQPLVAPLQRVFAALPRMLHQLLPAMRQLFAGAATLVMPIVRAVSRLAQDVLPLLGRAFRAVSPLIGPLIGGFSRLLTGLLPGLISLLRAARPAVSAIASVLGTLGRGVGMMLREFAPAVRASSVVLRAVGSVVAALLPVIGRLAGIFARTLAPIVVQFARVLRSLTPTLVIIGKLFADLAAAVLKDLVAAFGALAQLIILISPSIRILARALGQMFDILESSGVFAMLGTALEKIVPQLARLINLLVRQLAPFLPILIKLFISLVNAGIQVLVDVLSVALGVVTALVEKFPWLVPAIVAVVGAIKLWTIAQLLLDEALSANPIGLVVIAVGILVVAIIELVKHWGAVWGFIKRSAAAAWRFLTEGWGQYLIPQLKLIRVVVEFVRDHWRDAWNTMIRIGKDFWHWIWDDFGAKILHFFTQTLPGWWDKAVGFARTKLWNPLRNGFNVLRDWVHDHFITPVADFFTKTLPNKFDDAVRFIGRAWNKIKSVIRTPVAWVVDHVLNGLISVFDTITSAIGLGRPIKPVHPFGLQKGGRLPGYGGGDRVPALLEQGETVVSKEHSRQPGMLAAFQAAGVPGYQRGGTPGGAGTAGRATQAAFASSALAAGQTGSRRGLLGFIGHAIGNALGSMFPGLKAFGEITSGMANRQLGKFGHMGAGGAPNSTTLGHILNKIPDLLVHALEHWLFSHRMIAGPNIPYFNQSFNDPEVLRKILIPIFGRPGWGGTDNQQQTWVNFAGHRVQVNKVIAGMVRQIGARVAREAPGYVRTIGGYRRGPDSDITGYGGHHWGIALDINAAENMPNAASYSMPRSVIAQFHPGWVWGGTWAGYRDYMHMGFQGGTGGMGAGGQRAGHYSVQGMARLWQAVGGARNLAHLMGAIGMAESTGDPRARNASGASGLWQILMPANAWAVSGNVFNPLVNARAARTIYLNQGLRAWETYTNGAYRQFMDAGGWLHPGTTMVGNATGHREAVLNPGQSRAFLGLAQAVHDQGRSWPGTATLESKLERLIAAVERNATQTGTAVGDALNGVARTAAYRSQYSVR